MTDQSIQALVEAVETWNVLKKDDRKFSQTDMRKFIETMNFHTKKMIRTIGVENADFYTGLFELAQHACTLTTPGAKVFGDNQDRTNV